MLDDSWELDKRSCVLDDSSEILDDSSERGGREASPCPVGAASCGATSGVAALLDDSSEALKDSDEVDSTDTEALVNSYGLAYLDSY